MVRDTGNRQLKRYFVNMFKMPDEQGADKYNESCRVFDLFDQVIQNVEEKTERIG